MLRLNPYNESEHRQLVRVAFKRIFDKSELPYFDEFESGDNSFVGLDRNGRVQAFALVRPDSELAWLGVSPRYRRKGYAERMVQMILDRSEETTLHLIVFESNVAAIRLYEKCGFVLAEIFKTESKDRGFRFIL